MDIPFFGRCGADMPEISRHLCSLRSIEERALVSSSSTKPKIYEDHQTQVDVTNVPLVEAFITATGKGASDKKVPSAALGTTGFEPDSFGTTINLLT